MMKTQKRDFTPIVLALVAIALAFLAWRQGGTGLALDGIRSGGKILLQVFPLLIAAFLTAGLIQALVTEETVTRWLGSESGWRGIALACLGGALIPGGPYVYYPIAAALLNTGAGLGVLVAFISAKNLWSISRIPVEVALLGPRITIIRYVVTFAIPPLLGFAAEALFGQRIGVIRSAINKTSELLETSEVSGDES
ncbi:MAG: permease [Anaerolineales bacterium]|nr:permease [Chloroflexota bacterium]MBL6980766.1 permease [Anaerolineales bacterium]